jgi:hypothetical protein
VRTAQRDEMLAAMRRVHSNYRSEILWDRDFPLNGSKNDMVIMPSNAVPNVALS